MSLKEITDIVNILLPISLILNAVAYLPQIWRVCKMKKSKELSISTFILFWVGIFLVIAHGALQHDWLLVWSYFPSLVACTVMIALILAYRRRE